MLASISLHAVGQYVFGSVIKSEFAILFFAQTLLTWAAGWSVSRL